MVYLPVPPTIVPRKSPQPAAAMYPVLDTKNIIGLAALDPRKSILALTEASLSILSPDWSILGVLTDGSGV